MVIKGVIRKNGQNIDFAIMQQDNSFVKVMKDLPFMSFIAQFYNAILTDQDRILVMGKVYNIKKTSNNGLIVKSLEVPTPFFHMVFTKYPCDFNGNVNQLDKVNVSLVIPTESSYAEVNA